MPNSALERRCPKCSETAGNKDEVCCSECSTECMSAEVPPGKKKCVDCLTILLEKAKFCGKCGASQIKRKIHVCCGDTLSDDFEYCPMCGKLWSEESGLYTQETSSEVELDSVGKRAATEGEGSTETAATVINQNAGKTDPPSNESFPTEEAQSQIQQSHEAVETSSAITDIPEKPKESLSEGHAVPYVSSLEREEPHKDHHRSESGLNLPLSMEPTIAGKTTESDKAEYSQETRFSSCSGEKAPVYGESNADVTTPHETHQDMSVKEYEMNSSEAMEKTQVLDHAVSKKSPSTAHGNFNSTKSSSAYKGSLEGKLPKKEVGACNQTLEENNADRLEQVDNEQPETSSNADGPSTDGQLENSSIGERSLDREENMKPTLQGKPGSGMKETEPTKNSKVNSKADHNTPKTSSKRSTGSKLATETIFVKFKVVIGPEFKFDPSQHYVCMAFGDPQLGGWDTSSHQLDVERPLDDDYYLLSCMVNIPKQLLQQGGTEYKYIMASRSSKPPKWECIMEKRDSHHEINRSLQHGYRKEMLTVYDIIMFPDPKKFLPEKHGIFVVKWGGYFHSGSYEKLLKGRHIGTLAMLPDWPGTEFINGHKQFGVDFLAEIEAILKSMRRIILDDTFQNPDNTLIAKIMCEYLQTGMQLLAEIDPATEIGSKQKILIAMAALYIQDSIQSYLSEENVKLICENLLHIKSAKGPHNEMMKLWGSHLEGYNKKLTQKLKKFISLVMRRHSYDWLYAMPLLHFLSNDCQPYEHKDCLEDHNARDDRWWGLKEIQKDHQRFIRENRSYIPMPQLMEKLECFFQMDYLLPRTILATLRLYDLPLLLEYDSFDPEACLALVYRHFEWGPIDDQQFKNDFFKVLEDVQAKLTAKKQKWIQACKSNQQLLIQELYLCCHFCADILELTRSREAFHHGCQRIDYIDIFAQTSCMSIGILEFLDDQEKVSDLGNYGNDVKQQVINLQQKYTSLLSYWLHRALPDSMVNHGAKKLADEHELETWSRLLRISWPDRQIQEIYAADLRNHLESRIKELKSDVIALYALIDFNRLHPFVEKVISAAAFKAVEDACKSGDFFQNREFSRYLSCQPRISCILEQVFLSAWPKSDSCDQILKHTLQWPSMTNYIKLFYDKKRTLLNDTCLLKMQNCISVLEEFTLMATRGTIHVENLRRICENEKNYMDICELAMKVKPKFAEIGTLAASLQMTPKDVLRKILNLRNQELEEFTKVRSQVSILLTMCKEISPVDIDLLEKKEAVDGPDLFLNKMCRLRTPGQSDEDPLEITYFELPAAVYAILKDVPQYQHFQLFSLHWKKAANRFRQGDKEKVLSLEDIVKHVWNPSVSHCSEICREIQNGSIKLEFVESLIREISVVELKEEILGICNMTKIGGDLSWIDLRFKQLAQYEKMQSSKDAAESIMQIAKDYELEGDFSSVEKLLESVQNQQQLGSIDDKMVTTGQSLASVDEIKMKCIRSFIKAHDMIKWLRENLKGNQEVKVLVDLAMIRATGQGDIEVNRVSCLHLAVSGFAPLIYNLKKSAGFKEMMECLKEVWRVLETDVSLPSRLDEVSSHLQWLQDVHKSHGDVEMNALELTANINATGVFQIARPKNNLDGKVGIEDVVSLTIQADEKKKIQKLSLKELHDLQSKLMLVAGKAEKGKDEVDRFSQIFDGVIKLASTYVKICESGSIFFKDWKARFFCKKGHRYCVLMEFQLVKKTLFGLPAAGLDVIKHLDEICSFMENCLKDWTIYIDQQRDHYGELNYFTMTQLVKLRSSLANLKNLDPQVFHMLHIVKERCTEGELQKAMTSAMEILKTQEKSEEWRNHENEENEPLNRESEFIQELTEAGISAKLAAKAMKKFGTDTFVEALMWCSAVQMGDEEEDEEEECMDIQSNKTWAWVQENLLQEFEKNSQNACSLKPLLEKVWNQYLSTSTQSVSDYLSVEHLGLMLKHLRLQDDKDIGRTAPKHLVKGKPNLVVCPAWDVLNVVLSIYYQDQTKPLPKRDEVLYCTENTTQEEVNIFWRRALSDKTGRIFCILFVDQLSYDVSETAVRGLEKLMKDSNDYYLVIICASEGETKSQIVTSFENCRIGVPTILSDQICLYLKNKFKVEEDHASACVDSEKSTVRLIQSERPGMGKSLYVKRLPERLPAGKKPVSVTLPLHQRKIGIKRVVDMLVKYVTNPGYCQPRIFHFDIAYEVLEGVDYLLFNLLVLGSLSDQDGNVWQRYPSDLYVVETFPRHTLRTEADQDLAQKHIILQYLPGLLCRSPVESLNIHKEMTANPAYTPNVEHWSNLDQLMDEKTFRSEPYQRVFQYLRRLDQKLPMNNVNPVKPKGTKEECLDTLLRHFGVGNPTWAELHHFVAFLDKQLRDFEHSVFCQDSFAQDLPGFKAFVLRFMLQMSNDFATRSLVMTEETPGAFGLNKTEDLEKYQLRRRWEENPHPFLFFNDDHVTMTFLGFNINRASGNVIDPQTDKVIKKKIMAVRLYDALLGNRVNLSEKFDDLPRDLKIEKLCKVIGVPELDPDDTYQLTTDNVKKILAIQMRFRCCIPVVLMGETGCGKTRLIQFMCDLQVPPGSTIKNLIKVKTHGGTTEEDIRKKVNKACRLADANIQQIRELRGPEAYIQTVLFFDEANTTEAIGLIKEIMVDKSMDGQPLNLNSGLKIVAACNPYRRHLPEMVKKLEQAGLGYYVKADETEEKLGEIPMRQLVYRVQALPQSLLPLVWDFGQLSTNTEKLYIKQIVIRFLKEAENFKHIEIHCELISDILAASQEYIRQNKDECIFVSLRDVERVMRVMMWFYGLQDVLFVKIDNRMKKEKIDMPFGGENASAGQESDEYASLSDSQEEENVIDPIVRSLILALGVCYIASLEDRKKRIKYCKHIAKYFKEPYELEKENKTIEEQIETCQDVFVEEVQIEGNIAKNQALKENLFMMVVCVELRIPLFLVGKPGSSKSLAKTIVDNALKGRAAKSKLFRKFKQAHMISCQCSRLSTAEVIVGTFQQCAKLQENKKEHLGEFVSVVILDEVGLAEDSPHMPLKTLHPLLEDGCIDDEDSEPFKKVAFIGISNWALDPAKTNRGILVQRGVPTAGELEKTAKGISHNSPKSKQSLANFIHPLTKAYWEVYQTGLNHGSEFFGLRDFYSLIKMLVQVCEKSELSWRKMMLAVWRNFDGLENLGDDNRNNPIKIFEHHLKNKLNPRSVLSDDPQSENLISDGLSSEGRYLLILTEKDSPLDLLHQQLPHAENAIIIYGSSFPRDQEYTQVCRNINSIKMCMEAGRMVILHNLENLYESLYDALNQYYIIMGPNRFVDLGLGTQRVKCIVHKDFRLVVVAEKEMVYKKFSIPLINRLEKHFMPISSLLTEDQREIVENLQGWAEDLARKSQKSSPADLLVGYHVDAVATVVLQVSKDRRPTVLNKIKPDIRDNIVKECKEILLESADPEALMRLPIELDMVNIYFTNQSHESLADYLHSHLISDNPSNAIFCQITTYGKLLYSLEKNRIATKLEWESNAVILLQSLQAFNTEQQFNKMLRNLFMLNKSWDRVLILQCDSGNELSQLLACARHNIINTYQQCQEERLEAQEEKIGNTHVVLVVQLPRQKGGCFVSFQGGKWLSAHVDELRPSPHPVLVQQLIRRSVRELVEDAVKQDPKCRQYLTKKIYQMDGRKIQSAPKVGRGFSKTEQMQVDDFNDMPPLEEPDEDINVYRPERERMVEDVAMQDMSANDSSMDAGNTRLEMDDAQMETEDRPGEHITQEGGELSLQQLLFSCCCKAAIMLRDTNHMHTLERIHTIKEHFPEPGFKEYSDFAAIVQMRLLELLREKELRAGSLDTARKWLNGALQNISEIGTFRRTWMAHIEKQLAPLLAGLLKYADTNNNMAILEKTLPGDWRHQLWLRMFSDPSATTLKYKDLLYASSEMPKEFMVRMTGYGGVEMSGSLPFSWVIKDILDDLLEQAKKYRERPESDLDSRFHKTKIGMILAETYEEVGLEEVVNHYLDDYVRMVYRIVTQDKEKEYSLIKDMIITCYKNEKGVQGEEASGMKLCNVHSTFRKIQNRIQNLSQLLSLFPEGIDKMEKFIQENANHDLVKTSEMTKDMICVEACIQQLKPDSKEVGAEPEIRQAWLLKVELMLPVPDRIIEQLRQSDEEFGPVCRGYHHTLRCARDKVKAVYLFYKHVQSPQIRDDPMIKAPIPVWSFLRGESDFRKKETIEQVKKVIKFCNDQASKIYLKIKVECGVCKESMKDPVQLPCEDIFCKPCLEELKEFTDFEDCPTCKKNIPKKFKITVIPEKREAIEAHNRYKQRCNTFFIELISQLVFVGHEPVDEAVVEMLLTCVTRESKLQEAEKKQSTQNLAKRTKQLTVLDDCIDPTPVVRSLLLQLLLRARNERVEEYMDRYFNQAKQFLKNDDQQLLQLCLLFVHSFQDTFYHSVSQIVPGSVNEMEKVRILFEEAEKELDYPGLTMATIETLGKLRFCLDKLSGYLYQLFILKKGTSCDKLTNLLKWAEKVCSHQSSDYARWYLLRQLVRQSGFEYVVDMLRKNIKLMWILPPAITEMDFRQPHILSIYGDPFEQLKVGIRQACRANDHQILVAKYKNLPKKHRKIHLLVALYTDVTLSVAETLDDQNLQTPALIKGLSNCEIDPNSEMLKGLLGNQLGRHAAELTITQQQDVTEQLLAAVITHFIIVMTNLPNNSLTQPFKAIIEAPNSTQNLLLPTMPQDDLVEVYETMAQELKTDWDRYKNFGVYRCPNQHIFMVNNCGHLTDHKSLCPTCKAPIGGQGYNKPLPGVTNVKPDEIQDTTETGHCLGPAESRPKNPYPERKLNKVTTSVERFFVHLAMYAGANQFPEDVGKMIKPPLQESVNKFLWDHIVFDLDLLCKCINRSRDDVFMLMHILLKSMASTDVTGTKFSLKDKASRKSWEEAFANTYLNPILIGCNDELQQATTTLSSDNLFLKMLYEQEEQEGDSEGEGDSRELNFNNNVFLLRDLWRYKTRVCLEDVVIKLDEYHIQRKDRNSQGKKKKKEKVNQEKANPDDCDVLYNFLDKHEQLSAIRYLPNITRLVRGLVRENQRSLNYQEANKLTLDRFLNKMGDRIQKETYSSFIDDFAAAWDIVRPFLSSFSFGGLSIPKEYTMEPIRKERTVIATILPATEGRGLCAVGLIHYLADLQNDFLRTLPGVNLEKGIVSMEEVFPSNLIYFHPDMDLLPMFLAHCDYSLEVGKTLQIAYNFPALQRHLEERLLWGIPLIRIKVEQFLFTEDLTNAIQLGNLNEVIPQEYLIPSVIRQIQGELRHLSDITECLLNLDIALGFLVSFRNQSKNKMLTKFLVETLGMDISFFPQKVHQACELRHVKALWLLLCHERAKFLSSTAQDPFERVQHTYKEELTENDKTHLDALLPHLNADVFLAELHECILMQITKPVEKNADETIPNWRHSLVETLREYMSLKDEPPEIPVLKDERMKDTISASKCVNVWKYIFQKSNK